MMIGQSGGIISGEAVIGELRMILIAAIFASHRAVEAVEGYESEAVNADKFANVFFVEAVGEQFFVGGGVDAVEVGEADGRTGDAHMDFARTGFVEHLDDFFCGCAAHDAVINEGDFCAIDQAAIGIMFDAHAELADMLSWLNEGAANIMVAGDGDFKRGFGLRRIADGGWHAAIGHGNDNVGLRGRFLREDFAGAAAVGVDRALVDDAVGA